MSNSTVAVFRTRRSRKIQIREFFSQILALSSVLRNFTFDSVPRSAHE
jgi:hypothetical protein